MFFESIVLKNECNYVHILLCSDIELHFSVGKSFSRAMRMTFVIGVLTRGESYHIFHGFLLLT